MAATRSSPRKASEASKSTSRTAARAPVGVTKPPKVRKPSAKARQTQPDHPRSATSSPGNISPDKIPKTDLDASKDVKPRLVELERRLAEMEGRTNSYSKGHRVSDPPRRQPRKVRHISDSESSSEGEDEDEGPTRVSFKHIDGTRPFMALQSHYLLVDIKYFKQIFYGTFKPQDLAKLGHGLINKGDSDTHQDLRGVVQLIQCFGVYAMAVIYYAQPSAKFELTWALEEYRNRLADYSYSYKFDSLKEYNYAFMRARISEGQEDALAWRTEDYRCIIHLRLKTGPNEAIKPPGGYAAKSTLPGYGICRYFNEGRCTRERCKYSHICLNCQQNHSANTCQKPQTSASAANSIPQGNSSLWRKDISIAKARPNISGTEAKPPPNTRESKNGA